jgi:hypothetical protein
MIVGTESCHCLSPNSIHITQFVGKDFYVDDGLISCATSEEAIKVMKDTQEALMEFGNPRLHKFASNDPNVM